jgi:vacuolar-type H+-ATPase subunit E/Vma4
MTESLQEPIFQEILSDLRLGGIEDNESRDELIKIIENYIRHPVIVDLKYDMLARAKVEGYLLESVLKLLARDQFDPVGCVILAQQDIEIKVDGMSSMF